MGIYKLSNPPPESDYIRGLRALEGKLSRVQRALLRAQYQAPQRTATAHELAQVVGVQGHPVVNAQYGRLGHMLCDEIGFEPSQREIGTHRWWSVLSVGYSTPEGFLWEMLPQLAAALESLGWVSISEAAALPGEISGAAFRTFTEGAVRTVEVNAFERSPEARRRCIEHYGSRCVICRFDFAATYGAAVAGLIHVHHLRPLSEIGEEYEVDPVADLRPVCPNCHAVIHRRTPAYTIEETRAMLQPPSTLA